MIQILFLFDCPEYIPQVAKCYSEHWGKNYPERTLKDWENYLGIDKYNFPITFIALDISSEEKPKLVGTASLRLGEVSLGDENTVWLSGIYVIPEERHKGIASSLIQHCEEFSTTFLINEKPIKKLTLFTRTSGQLYKKQGWTIVGNPDYQGGTVLLMEKKLLPLKAGYTSSNRYLSWKQESKCEADADAETNTNSSQPTIKLIRSNL